VLSLEQAIDCQCYLISINRQDVLYGDAPNAWMEWWTRDQ